MSTALVVDDNRHTADMLCQMLSFLGMTAVPAYGPRAAILSLKETTPDAIFLDINMPGIDGFEIMAYLRASRVSVTCRWWSSPQTTSRRPL